MSGYEDDDLEDAEEALMAYADGTGTYEDAEAALDALDGLTMEEVTSMLSNANIAEEFWDDFLFDEETD